MSKANTVSDSENSTTDLSDLHAQMSQMMGASSAGGSGEAIDSGFLNDLQLGNIPDGGGGRLLPLKGADGQIAKYDWVVSEALMKTSSTGNKMLSIKLTGSKNTPSEGIVIYDNCVFIDNSLWKFKSLARAAGLLAPDGSAFIGNSTRDFVGKLIAAPIKHDTYEGVTRNKIASGYEISDSEYGNVPQTATSPNFN